MSNGELVRVIVEGVSHHDRIAWADGLTVCLPESVLTGRKLDAGTAIVSPQDVTNHRLRAAFTEQRPISSRMPISYQILPAWTRNLIARAIGALNRKSMNQWASFPMFPLDLSADLLHDLTGGPPSPFSDGRTPVLLTHDLDSPEGLRKLVRDFIDTEEQVEARSTNFIVPCATRLDHSLLAELRARGHQIGIHGYDHSNLTPFADSNQRAARLEAA